MEQQFKDHLKSLYGFMKDRLNFDRPARIIVVYDQQNAQDPLGKTAFYNPNEYLLKVHAQDRHPKDILRSVAHELVHHKQNCANQFSDDIFAFGEDVKDNKKLKKLEEEAYQVGNILFREWEEQTRKKNLNEAIDIPQTDAQFEQLDDLYFRYQKMQSDVMDNALRGTFLSVFKPLLEKFGFEEGGDNSFINNEDNISITFFILEKSIKVRINLQGKDEDFEVPTFYDAFQQIKEKIQINPNLVPKREDDYGIFFEGLRKKIEENREDYIYSTAKKFMNV